MVNQPVLIAAVGGTAVAAAIAINVFLWQDEVEAPAAPAQTGQAAVTDSAEPPAPAAANGAVAPSFDVVRVDPQGQAVMAGRALPGSTVIIMEAGQAIGEVTADKRGEWVFVPATPLSPGSRELSLEMRARGGNPVRSDDVVVLVVPEADKDVAGRPAEGTAGALALKLPRGGGASTVLQAPGDGEGGKQGAEAGKAALSVDTLDYDDSGQLSIGGRARPGQPVNLYLDQAFIGRAAADDNGLWRLRPETRIQPGLYTLRADAVDPAGRVTARVSMPFSRAEPMTDAPPEPFVIVQPGNSLWRLARRAYGQGVRYSLIFDANREQIKDPDLIYPGQVFALPATN